MVAMRDVGRGIANIQAKPRASRRLLALLSAAAFFSLAPAALGAPPPNDEPTGAELLPDGPYPVFSSTVDITDATTSANDPACNFSTSQTRSVWFRFTPGQTATYRISTAGNTTLDDPLLGLYTSAGGAAGPFTERACNDDYPPDTAGEGSRSSRLSIELQAGTEYWLVVSRVDATVYGGPPAPPPGQADVQLRIDRIPPPANDVASGASELRLNRPSSGDLEAAANDYTLAAASPCYSGIGHTTSTGAGRDLTFEFTAPQAGAYTFRAYNYTSLNSHLLYVASSLPDTAPGSEQVPNTDCLAAANRSNQQTRSAEEVSPLSLTAGQRVYVVVDQTSSNSYGSFDLVVERAFAETEPNDEPATASPAPACGVRGTITPASDPDFFSVGTPAAGSRLFAMADGQAATSTNFDMRLTTATDTLQYDDRSLVLPFGGLAPSIAGSPLTGAPSYLRLSHVQAAEPYRLYSVVQPPSTSAVEETEPNNDLSVADPAGAGYLSGTISPADADAYSFRLPARTLVYVALDADPTRTDTPVNASMVLTDADGQTLVGVDETTTTSSSAPGAGSLTATSPNSPSEALVYRTRAAGTYHVRVYAADSGDYLLSIAPNCRAGAAPQIELSPASLAEGVPGTAYSQDLDAAGGNAPYEFELASGSLPPGLSLAQDGTLSGTPSQTGSFTFTVLVTDEDDFTGEREYSLAVRVQPGLVTSASATVRAGGAVSDSATLSDGQTPTGSIAFELFGPGDPSCAGPPVFTTSEPVNGNGIYESAEFITAEAGTYRWIAAYGGDTHNRPISGACGDPGESVVVSRAQPTLSTVASPGVEVGGQVHDTATLAGGAAPGGTITFRLYGPGDTSCAGPPLFTSTRPVSGNGDYASSPYTTTQAGVHRWVAAYGGDPDNEAAAGACGDGGESVTVTAPTVLPPTPDPIPPVTGPGDVIAPETLITASPKKKLKAKGKGNRARATFGFSSNEPGARFECSLDGVAFATCDSPVSSKLAIGRHLFAVRAVDLAGNRDASPAEARVRVVRRKRR